MTVSCLQLLTTAVEKDWSLAELPEAELLLELHIASSDSAPSHLR